MTDIRNVLELSDDLLRQTQSLLLHSGGSTKQPIKHNDNIINNMSQPPASPLPPPAPIRPTLFNNFVLPDVVQLRDTGTQYDHPTTIVNTSTQCCESKPAEISYGIQCEPTTAAVSLQVEVAAMCNAAVQVEENELFVSKKSLFSYEEVCGLLQSVVESLLYPMKQCVDAVVCRTNHWDHVLACSRQRLGHISTTVKELQKGVKQLEAYSRESAALKHLAQLKEQQQQQQKL
eukprot:PhM_4_TR9751/c3_g1_i1/m.80844